MKRDGNKGSTFHEKVDKQGPTITLFETEDGYKFGGYTSKSFKIGSSWIKDSDSFADCQEYYLPAIIICFSSGRSRPGEPF